jgi:hypothetical protein
MGEFKVGDKIRLTDKSVDKKKGRWGDRTGTIVGINPLSGYPFIANSDDGTCEGFIFAADELELVVENEAVEHPAHYGGDTTYEVIKVAEAWGLDKDAYLFNVLKYIARAGKKDGNSTQQDLSKGRFYIDARIRTLEEASGN